ncbi:MAG: T9SS type A sorting domain-containing protein [Ignavibacteria bacterium]|nr:T9SS type A sorting domain-containing protein [Ignavibacteria bacterium]
MRTLNLIFKTTMFFLAFVTTQLLIAQNTFRCLEFSTPEIGITVGDNGMMMKTEDGGQTWFEIQSNTVQNLWKTSAVDGDTIVVVGNGGTILKSSDAGTTWQPMQSGTTTDLFGVYAREDGTGFAVGRNGSIFKSTDHGSNWEVVIQNHGNDLRAISMYADNGVIVGDKNHIFFTTDAGATWNAPNTVLPFELSFRFVRVIDHTTVFATSTVGDIIKSIDGGNSWNIVYSNSAHDALYRVNFVRGNIVCVGDNGKIIISQDMGETWLEINSGISTDLYCLNFADDLTGYAAGENGVMLKTVDGGFSWEVINYTLHKLDEPKTSHYENMVTNNFKLEQNYPNPFNPETKINFYLPVNGNTSLKVYDISGREITTIINGFRLAGNYSVTFNANKLAAGIYLYSLYVRSEYGNYSKTNKMILVK